MRTLKYLAVALALFGANGAAMAVPRASETVHLAPGVSVDQVSVGTDTHASTTLSSRHLTVASEIEWPVVSGDEAAKAIAAQKAASLTPPAPTLLANINLTTQRMTVTESGVVKYTWLISSGRQGYDTPTGVFRPTWKSAMWYSRQYDMSPMPHSVFFSGGAAVHATYAVNQLGTAASHGCVRVSPRNAEIFYGLVGKHGMDRTRITVHGKPNYSKWNVADGPRRYAPTRYVMAPYGFAPPGYFSQQYFKPNQARRTAQRVYRTPSYAYGIGF